ncbi:RagB/SusD family nutrient uptake outer membrane protein [Winogradskyella sp. J14-2]|uniref:RagB/SusD family nutrient uptake outer membrane protein n=1 Tax=Winogradskyella sp. J14-2 TaxID=1936080 RepID=UPI000972CA4B|nr:RagB/SusD family nutrient uptake outer membrane protein [Winogradskyella sp. J14-2]
MKRTTVLLFVAFLSLILVQSCADRLDLQPEDERLVGDAAFDDPASYEQFLGKLYAGISLSGQQGPAGQPDLQGLDEGFSNYLRLYWKMQELTTDEAIIAWNDGTIQDLHNQVWTSGNEFIRTMYSRIMYQVALCNEFLRQTTDGKLSDRGVEQNLIAEIQIYRAEARFLRALSYWHAMDLYANPPFVTENDPIGAFLPPQISRTDLFNYIENELIDILDEMAPANADPMIYYGRADRGAAWMLLAKLYLNAEVYTGTARYSDALTYVNNIIGAGYNIDTSIPYGHSFLADNSTNGAQSEVIFTIPFDGLRTQAFGGMTFLTHAPVGGTMNDVATSFFGINGGWFGIRTTPTFVELFPDEENSADGRALLWTDGQEKDINSITTFTDGYGIFKYRNVDVDGNQGSDTTGDHTDIDFPMFRLADAYLMYAEIVARGAGGDINTAVSYINTLRERAYGNASGNISAGDITLDFIINERGRELYWEAHRRTDLIRFNQFSENGVWQWKGGIQSGTTTEAFRDIMPIPETDLGLNTNLEQNPGY